MHRLFRLIAVFTLLSLYVAASVLLTLIPMSAMTKRRARTEVVSFFTRRLAFVLEVRISEEHRRTESPRVAGRGKLILANHLSFLDIVALSSLRPSVFVTSVEMEQAPGAGLLAKWGGSLFVERRQRTRVLEDAEQLAQVLAHGMDVVLFPEGTSGDGRTILPFKAGLLRNAVHMDVPVQPVCIQYETLAGRPITDANAEEVFFCGPQSLGQHLWRLITNPEVRLTLKWLEALPSAQGLEPRAIANQMRDKIVETFRAIPDTARNRTDSR